MYEKKGLPKTTAFFQKNRFWMAVATLIGTIIGAGVLGIPYVIAQSGFLIGAIDILLIGLAILILNLYLGEIILRTKGTHQLTGYMEIYLGKWGKRFMAFSMIFGIYGALLAYLIGEGEALKSLFGGNALIYSLIFFITVAIIVYKGIRATGRTELIIVGLMILVVLIIGFTSWHGLSFTNYTNIHLINALLPYGVILFAFIGTAALPEIKEILIKEKKKMKRAILWGTLIPVFLYLLFSAIVIGIISLEQFEALQPNERIATIALSICTNSYLGAAANIFAIFASDPLRYAAASMIQTTFPFLRQHANTS